MRLEEWQQLSMELRLNHLSESDLERMCKKNEVEIEQAKQQLDIVKAEVEIRTYYNKTLRKFLETLYGIRKELDR